MGPGLAGMGMGSERDPYAPTAAEVQRARAMRRAWDAYAGRWRGGNPQWPLLWQPGTEADPNVRTNRCGPAVDTDCSWLFGASVGVTVQDGDAEDAEAEAAEAQAGEPGAAARAQQLAEAQAYVDAVWGVSTDRSSDDDRMTLLQELALQGAVTGTAFLKVVWDSAQMDYPELVVLDSAQVRVITAPHHAKVAVAYVVEYAVPGQMGRGDDTYRQVHQLTARDGTPVQRRPQPGDTWTITDFLKLAGGTLFTQVGQPQTWPFPWAAIDGCQHLVQAGGYYGRPRLTDDLITLNETLCLVASNINKIGLRHGHPVLFTVLAGAERKEMRHTPGTILEVGAPIQAVQAHGDLQHLMQFAADLRADFDESSHIPSQAFGRLHDLPRLPQSGVAIRLGYGPLLADIIKERRTYGALLRRVTRHLLALRNPAWAGYDVALGWQDPLPADDLQKAQVLQTYRSMGIVSLESAAAMAGLDWDLQQQQLREEDAEQVRAVMSGQGLPSLPPADQPTTMTPMDGSDQPVASGVAG